MIRDTLARVSDYRDLPQVVSEALAYLRATDFAKLAEGRYEIDGDRLVAIVQSIRTKPASGARWEAHRQYIDVQYVIEGVERMGHLPRRDGLPVAVPYDTAADIVFFDAQGEFFDVPSGSFAIFTPEDVHAPGLSPGEPAGDVRKVVVKCRIAPTSGCRAIGVAACGPPDHAPIE